MGEGRWQLGVHTHHHSSFRPSVPKHSPYTCPNASLPLSLKMCSSLGPNSAAPVLASLPSTCISCPQLPAAGLSPLRVPVPSPRLPQLLQVPTVVTPRRDPQEASVLGK